MNVLNPANQSIPTKRKRGAQLGNKNAKGNRGNHSARGKSGNRGGKGAPVGNQFARKLQTFESELLKEYRANTEALAWIQANSESLRDLEVCTDSVLDAAVFLGLSVEHLDRQPTTGKRKSPFNDDTSGSNA